MKLVLTPNNFLASAREILVIEKSNAGLEFEVLGLFNRGGTIGAYLDWCEFYGEGEALEDAPAQQC